MLWLAGVAVARVPVAATSGQSPRHRVGILVPAATQWDRHSFVDELNKLGRRVDEHLLLHVRSADGDLARLPELAQLLAADGVDVIVGVNTPGARAAIGATDSLPVVVAIVADPVAAGFVDNIARPGGRVTGVANMAGEIAPKRLEILKEALPGTRRVVGLYHPEEAISAPQIADLRVAAPRLGIDLRFSPVRSLEDVEHAMAQAAAWRADAVFRLAGQALTLARESNQLAVHYRLPLMSLNAEGVRLGGLLSYFADHAALWRRVAHQVSRILAGDAPGSLPFEQPTRFELVVNLQTARAIGVVLAPSILARADEVIE